MLSAFSARPIVELKQRDKSKIESVLAYSQLKNPHPRQQKPVSNDDTQVTVYLLVSTREASASTGSMKSPKTKSRWMTGTPKMKGHTPSRR